MKKLTKKQRGKIYLKMAKKPELRLLCSMLSLEVGSSQLLQMEEFFLFSPTREEKEGVLSWWYKRNDDEYMQSVRETCMLLCYEMTK